MKRETIQNLAVMCVSIGGAALCAILLYQDMYLHKSSVDGHLQAGRLVEKRQTVKRKLGDNLIWDLVSDHETLYWNDSIQTEEKSGASITLDDGSQIRLGESSLVVLERDNDHLNLDLKSGQIVVAAKQNSNESQSIKVNGASVVADGGQQVAIQMDTVKHQVTATTTMADGTTKQMTVDQSGHVEEKEIPVSLQFPQSLTRVTSDKNQASVEFKWQAPANKKKILQVSSDSQFKHIVRENEGTSDSLKADLQAGTYYWRVKVPGQATKSDVVSETRSFDIIETSPVPTDSMVGPGRISYKSEVPIMEFKWAGNPSVSKFLFEVSDSDGFKNVLFKKEITDNTVRTSTLPPGHLFWRVTSVFGDVSKLSIAKDFKIEKLLSTEPPVNLQPEKDFKVTYEYFDKLKGIPFHWKSPTKESTRFAFSKSSDLKDELVAFETTQEDTFIKEPYPAGSYYWGVGSKDENGKWVYLDIHKIELGPLTPPPSPPTVQGPSDTAEVDLLKDPHIKWTWDEVNGAKEYHFKLIHFDEHQKEEVVLEDKLKGFEKGKDDLPDGKYKWTVSAVDTFGRESKPTIHEFNVFHGKTLEAPAFEMSEVQ